MSSQGRAYRCVLCASYHSSASPQLADPASCRCKDSRWACLLLLRLSINLCRPSKGRTEWPCDRLPEELQRAYFCVCIMRPSNAGERPAEAVRQAAGWGVQAALCPACGHVPTDPPHRDGGPAEEGIAKAQARLSLVQYNVMTLMYPPCHGLGLCNILRYHSVKVGPVIPLGDDIQGPYRSTDPLLQYHRGHSQLPN